MTKKKLGGIEFVLKVLVFGCRGFAISIVNHKQFRFFSSPHLPNELMNE